MDLIAPGQRPKLRKSQATLRRHDKGQGSVASYGAATLLHPRPTKPRRPSRLCTAHALYPEQPDQAFPEPVLAAKQDRGWRGASGSRADRRAGEHAADV